eukprot:gnl/TRDRNA2_/TRDRNA2_167835_c8_seq1.p1 gnl/TRDRNA2_/TRDRNA2_167835_c8~~gnl/TRDRNA2_/TRDRNA2_167835_c8_seq1.p1  ORF type:complete len:101 (+),score=0.96 gnl/TRDRNA2_/TRDRNA2_167835_c8_seq1:29-331(+)
MVGDQSADAIRHSYTSRTSLSKVKTSENQVTHPVLCPAADFPRLCPGADLPRLFAPASSRRSTNVLEHWCPSLSRGAFSSPTAHRTIQKAMDLRAPALTR